MLYEHSMVKLVIGFSEEHMPVFESGLNRRSFLKVIGTAAAAASVSTKGLTATPNAVCIVVDPSDEVAAAQPVKWAIDYLAKALQDRGVLVTKGARPEHASEASFCIFASGADSATARQILHEANVSIPDAPEALGLVTTSHQGLPALLACGRDRRGLVYALTELADMAQYANDPAAALQNVETTIERPANQVRSINRLFCSDVEDKPWFNDRDMWPAYFDLLVSQRFNRFNLAFGIGYDFIRKVTDAYFLFTYPFLLNVPGYNVHVPQLPDEERDRNLEMLRYISEQCVMRGLEFYVGLWMHGYEWIDSPNANYTIEGLDKNSHGPYCRDAVRLLLQRVPNIHGLTFRIHGESGVAEGNFEFWKTVFDGVATCGRQVNIDMHPKGMSQQMLEVALATKQPVAVSPKFWGEHVGMTYHQADIRKIEKPRSENKPGLMALSEGTRSFLRYGYGDLLNQDRKWTVVHRIWPGTQRILIWGDPTFAAGYSKAFSFCGSSGVEIMEPLSFKGRRGSGHAGSRCGYADRSCDPRWDWQKFEYSTRIWGRLLYDPETKPIVWQRWLQRQFGPGYKAIETALANVSRILPIVTTAHAPSAGNNMYWPELYFNQSMVDAENFQPYFDTFAPRVFGNASPFDPELFSSINEYAEELLKADVSGKYSPVEVAQWIEDLAEAGRKALAQAEASATSRTGPTYRRFQTDIAIQIGVGEFFAAKFRSGVLFHIYELTGDQAALEAAITKYKAARAAWAHAADAAKGIYVADITVGEQPYLRGNWLDRLQAIDRDIQEISAKLIPAAAQKKASPKVLEAIQAALGRPNRAPAGAEHALPAHFMRGRNLPLTISVSGDTEDVRIHYRHVNQAETYVSSAMQRQGSDHLAIIPAAYTDTTFPIEYFFELSNGDGKKVLYPGFTSNLTNQPYFVVLGD
jgi:hypothetical protein